MSNFDNVIERKNTNCIKYDSLEKYFGVKNAKPLWVADMDFAMPDFVVEDLAKRLEHPILGYEKLDESFSGAVISWYERRHKYTLKHEEITFVPGVVAGINMAVEAFSKEGDEVIIQSPVYHPFYSVVKDQNRKVVTNPLKKDKDNNYEMDFKDLKNKINKRTKILILCSPHNPVGKVWSKKELKKLGKICCDKGILLISDEIHSDLVFKDFTPISKISKKIAKNTLTFNAPSKTFNLAGLNTSYAYSKSKKILKKYLAIQEKRALGMPNIFGVKSLISAYSKGDTWLEELLGYLKSNFQLVLDELSSTKIKVKKPEATYLMWLDFSEYKLTQKQLQEKLYHGAKLILNNGMQFGKEGKNFFRLNVALPKSELKKALESLKKEFN